MAEEGTYEYELMRAELLGVAPPDKQVFEENLGKKALVDQEELEVEQAKELEAQSGQMKGATGKLDELNSILSKTQFKLNKFKTVCGSLTNLLKIKSDSQGNSQENLSFPDKGKDPNLKIDDALDAIDTESNSQKKTTEEIRTTKLDLSRQMTSHMDKLDSMINKAEKAGNSMEQQNKQMKMFMR